MASATNEKPTGAAAPTTTAAMTLFTSYCSLIQIEEDDAKIHERTIGSGETKRLRREQQAYLHQHGRKYPVYTVLTVPDSVTQAYPAGLYSIDPASIKVGKYDALELSRFDLRLVRLPPDVEAELREGK